jgi:G3E family GTPase
MNKSGAAVGSKKRTEILVLAGFLGAGKTTLLRRIISCGDPASDTVVIVNEFGEIGIDGALIRERGSDVIELTNGCICCTLLVDLTVTLESVLARFDPRTVIIEASGVADPRNVAAALQRPGIRERVALHRTVTVLDAQVWEMRGLFGELFNLQLEMADLVLLNKIDLSNVEKTHAFLREIHEAFPRVRVVPTSYGRIDPDSVWGDSAAGDALDLKLSRLRETYCDRETQPKWLDSRSDLDHDRDADPIGAGFVTFAFQSATPLKEQGFRDRLSQLPFEVFRVKGTVDFGDRTMLLNSVGGRAEWSEWNGGAETKLVFVGWDVNGDGIICKLKECVL